MSETRHLLEPIYDVTDGIASPASKIQYRFAFGRFLEYIQISQEGLLQKNSKEQGKGKWSMTVNMKIDLVGKEKRGLALRLNEFAGYISVALISFLTGYIAAVYGLKPHPFYIGIAFSLLALLISVLG
jgi:hypothetical protein